MVKVLIADDHPIVRQGLKQILMDEEDMVVLGEASNDQELLQLVLKQNWDIAILDITMPGRSGLDMLKELKQIRPKLPILILSMHPEDQYAIRCIKAGADGYMVKGSAPEDLAKAIRKILIGGKYISQALTEKLVLNLQIESEKPLHHILSDREYQVMIMLASGKRVNEIAEELSLSIKTISTYRSRILEKMQMKSNQDLTYYAIKNKLIE